jgi:hypothetical protein
VYWSKHNMAGYIGSKSSVTLVDGITEEGGTLTGDLSFGDNDKAKFGAGDDLQIYHDGSHSRITDAGTGSLLIDGDEVYVRSSTGENKIIADTNGGVNLFYDNASKLATTATGVDVTGTVTADAYALDSIALPSAGTATIFNRNTDNNLYIQAGSGNTLNVLDGSQNTMYSVSPTLHSFSISNSEKMRISSGDLLVGRTSVGNTANGHSIRGGDSAIFSRDAAGETVQVCRRNDQGDLIQFRRNGTICGEIVNTGGASVAYNTSSDYRLKENIVDLTGASARVNQLDVKRFNFIADGTDTVVDGFLAHEVADVVPEAVTGAKDAMRDEEYEVTPAVLDDDGNVTTEAVMGTRSVPKYQGIDQSKLVPLLTAALQEALTEIASLKTRVEALEA